VLSDLNHLLKPLLVHFDPDTIGPCWEFGKKPGALGDGFNNSPTLGVGNQDFDIAEVIAFCKREAEMQVIFLFIAYFDDVANADSDLPAGERTQ
jgi:hypothetical protein